MIHYVNCVNVRHYIHIPSSIKKCHSDRTSIFRVITFVIPPWYGEFAVAHGERRTARGSTLWNVVSSAFFQNGRTWPEPLMGHARAFTRKLWKSTVTILCEARLNDERKRRQGRKKGVGRREFTGYLEWNVGIAILFRTGTIIFSFFFFISEQ